MGRGNGCKLKSKAKRRRKGIAPEPYSAISQDTSEFSNSDRNTCNTISFQDLRVFEQSNLEPSTDIDNQLQSKLDQTKKVLGLGKKTTEVDITGDRGKDSTS